MHLLVGPWLKIMEVVGDRKTFSLATFLDREGMKGLGSTFNKGPNKEAFKCPIKL